MWSVKELLSGFKTKHFGVSFHMAELVQPQYDEVTVVILRIWGSDWAFFWASRTPPHRGITQYWVLTYNVAKLYQKYLISGNPATLSIILFFFLPAFTFPKMDECAQNTASVMMLKVSVRNSEDHKIYKPADLQSVSLPTQRSMQTWFSISFAL